MAEIQINQEQWQSISAEDREKITEGLRSVGSLKDGDSIVGVDSVAPFTEETEISIERWNPLKDLKNLAKKPCELLCDATAGAALAWCTANTAGIGLAACCAAAEAARSACKRHC